MSRPPVSMEWPASVHADREHRQPAIELDGSLNGAGQRASEHAARSEPRVRSRSSTCVMSVSVTMLAALGTVAAAVDADAIHE